MLVDLLLTRISYPLQYIFYGKNNISDQIPTLSLRSFSPIFLPWSVNPIISFILNREVETIVTNLEEEKVETFYLCPLMW